MKSYPSYKDSGVEWIGEIPSEWSKSKLKYISNLFTGNSLNDEQKRMYESNNPDDIPYVSSKDIDVNYHTVVYDNGLRIPSENNPLKIGHKGSFLLCVEGGSSGRKMVFLEQDVCFVNKLCCFESDQITKFQFYFIQSSNFQFKFKLSLTGLIGGVSISTLRNFELPSPPKETQTQIVSFLDIKTQKIDELIEKTEKKIELLKEKRTSLINHCVTKGLNPDVEMKDSEVEWIGDIPSHWEVKPIKYISDYNQDSLGSDTPSEYELDYLEISDVNSVGEIGKPTHYTFSKSPSRCRRILNKNDIIISTVRTYLRSIGFIENEVQNLICSTGFCVLTPKNMIEPKLLFYLVRSEWFISKVISKSVGVSYPGIQTEKLMSIKVLLPPISEQTQIIEYLDERTQKIDTTIEKETQRTELLKEYRQSLISEVVTGKIDVRNYNG